MFLILSVVVVVGGGELGGSQSFSQNAPGWVLTLIVVTVRKGVVLLQGLAPP